MRCAAYGCQRDAGGSIRDGGDPLLSRLCLYHRTTVREAVRHGLRAELFLERMVSAPLAGALCSRCGVRRAGAVRPNTAPGTETLCRRCRQYRRERAASSEHTPDERPLCIRCGVVPQATRRHNTRPGGEGLCTPCREHLRDCRVNGTVRPQALHWRRVPEVDLVAMRRENDAVLSQYERPTVRGDCLEGGCNAQRPCPFVSCKWHLYLDVTRAGSLRLNFPGMELDELRYTCALDVADAEGVTLEDLGASVNLVRERVRQIESAAMWLLRPAAARLVGEWVAA